MRHNLTAQFIESFKAPWNGKDREIAWDAKQPGFGLRVTANGARTWVVMYRYRHGRARFMTLGTYPAMGLADAREQARDALAKAQKGGDPASEKQANRAAGTWGELCERFLAEYPSKKNLKPRTVKEYEHVINSTLLPKWGNRKMKDVSRADVKALIGGIEARGAKVQANRVLSAISVISNFGVDQDVLEFNPAVRVTKTKEKSRERVLSADEIRAVWGALSDDPQEMWMKLLLLTGQRSTEVAEMRWDEIDFETSVWTIPASRAKNGLSHRVPLVGQALAILRDLYRDGAAGPFFGHSSHAARANGADRVRKATAISFTPHDLRRTLSTGLAQLRVDEAVIEKILNHSKRSVATIYNRYSYDAEKRDALQRWDRHIARILSGERAQVIPFPASA